MGEHPIRGVATSHGDGVYRSSDGGKTWQHLGLERTRHISRIRIHPHNPDLVYVAAQGAAFGPNRERGIYRSKDGGRTWEQVLFVSETAGASDLAMDLNNPRILYAAFWDHQRFPWYVRSGGPGSGLWKSTDGGDTWQKIDRGLPPLMGKLGIDVSRADPRRVYAIVEADPGGGLYRSDDGGASWRLMSDNWSIRARAWYYINVYADPQNPDVVYVMNAAFWKSVDGGRTFTQVRVPHGDNHDLWINPDDNRNLINANDGGANVSFNGGLSWSTQANQPTGQFYRVNTDNRFPYYVYGGQQDNTTVAIASRGSGAGITERDWYPVGGCESGYVAFDPDDPRFVYAGCYHGQLTEWDAATRQARDVMPYPALPLALPSRELKYRYNWNTPIVVSLHDPRVIYHAANVLFKSQDRGRSWVQISNDLTRNDPEKQGPGGGPITNEGAGGEVYGTIFYVMESRQDRNTIWVGSDDGLVHLTRDGGRTWTNVTPPGLPEAQINAIETSPHADGTAYLAVTRYKFNDFTPLIYKTTDYGRSWRKIAQGIAPEAWVRVVREDPVRPGLLYAGTELGMYLSFDGGEHWQPWQLNLPVVPVTDLKVHGNDLVASTQGRAFWILDDLSPVRQVSSQVAQSDFYLYQPADAYRLASAGGFGPGGGGRAGENPPTGALFYYHLKSAATDSAPVTLEILDSTGTLVRRFSSRRERERGRLGTAAGPAGEEAGPPGPFGLAAQAAVLPASAGLNRFVWDLRHERPTAVPGLYVFGAVVGRRVVPGTYQVRLTVNGKSQTRSFRVLADPRVEASRQDFIAQDELARRISEDLSAIHGGVNRLRAVRDQLEQFLGRLSGLDGSDGVQRAGRSLVERLNALEDSLVQKRTVDGQTVINFPVRLNHHFVHLLNAVDGADAGLTQGAGRRYADLAEQWARLRAELERLLGAELEGFNRMVRDQGLGPIVVPVEGGAGGRQAAGADMAVHQHHGGGMVLPATSGPGYSEADVRFMQDMIGHHEQAIAMARLAVVNGAGEEVRRLAVKMEISQRDEIALMESWLRERGQVVPDQEYRRTKRMPGMLSAEQMAELERARGEEFDRLFLRYMIQHHNGALEMVAMLFAAPGAGQDPDVFRFATDVDVDQRAEIALMQGLLEQLVARRGS
jgi:uncharacterized protein (DUF305 family)/photosystem II stability/assembly factor-like uncharacterized protein